MPARQNTLLVLGPVRDEPRFPTSEELCGIGAWQGMGVVSFEEADRLTRATESWSLKLC